MRGTATAVAAVCVCVFVLHLYIVCLYDECVYCWECDRVNVYSISLVRMCFVFFFCVCIFFYVLSCRMFIFYIAFSIWLDSFFLSFYAFDAVTKGIVSYEHASVLFGANVCAQCIGYL